MKISDWVEEKDIHSVHPLKGHSMSSTFIRAQKIPVGEGGETHPRETTAFFWFLYVWEGLVCSA